MAPYDKFCLSVLENKEREVSHEIKMHECTTLTDAKSGQWSYLE